MSKRGASTGKRLVSFVASIALFQEEATRNKKGGKHKQKQTMDDRDGGPPRLRQTFKLRACQDITLRFLTLNLDKL